MANSPLRGDRTTATTAWRYRSRRDTDSRGRASGACVVLGAANADTFGIDGRRIVTPTVAHRRPWQIGTLLEVPIGTSDRGKVDLPISPARDAMQTWSRPWPALSI